MMRLVPILAAVLGLWLQAMLPAADAVAAPREPGLAAFCGHPPPATPSGPVTRGHRHCLLCQAGSAPAILPLAPRPPSPAPAAVAAVAVTSDPAWATAFRAYASRAPPDLG